MVLQFQPNWCVPCENLDEKLASSKKKKSVNTVNTMPLTSINFSTHETSWHSQKISDPNGNVAGASVTSNMLKPHLSVFQDEDSFN